MPILLFLYPTTISSSKTIEYTNAENENMKYEVTDIQGEKETFEGNDISHDLDRISIYDEKYSTVVLLRASMVDRIERIE